MCLAIPGVIIALDNYDSALIDILGLESKVNIQLIENLKVGDYVLIHAGCAIQKIDKDYFEELQKIFQSILDSEEKCE
jgi:hydrogenase expression/formation protein HypC